MPINEVVPVIGLTWLDVDFVMNWSQLQLNLGVSGVH